MVLRLFFLLLFICSCSSKTIYQQFQDGVPVREPFQSENGELMVMDPYCLRVKAKGKLWSTGLQQRNLGKIDCQDARFSTDGEYLFIPYTRTCLLSLEGHCPSYYLSDLIVYDAISGEELKRIDITDKREVRFE